MASTVPPGMQPPGISNNAASAGGLKRKLEDTQSSASNININTNPSSSMDKKQRPPMPPTYMLASLVPESEVFADLLRMEQKLDWTMLRKKAEVTDALGKPVKIKRTLRLYISNTTFNQSWQMEAAREAGQETDVDIDTGAGVPAWQLRLEGRLLDTNNTRIDKFVKRKFSNVIHSVTVEFDRREPQNFPESNIVEWFSKSQAPGQAHDGFEIRRRGDMAVNCRIIIRLDQFPDRFKVLSPLADMIGIKEESRGVIMSAMWKYVKTIGAQDRDDPTKLMPINGLEQVLNPSSGGMSISNLPELVNQFLTVPDPVILNYRIEVDMDRNVHPKVFDIPIEIEDPLKTKYHSAIQSLEGPQMKEVMAAEDEVARLAHTIRDSRQKRDFLEQFAEDPQGFVQRWLSSQSRDLDTILGNSIGSDGTNGGGVKEEDLRRSDLFRLPWVEEAVTIQEGIRLERQAQQMREAQARRGPPGPGMAGGGMPGPGQMQAMRSQHQPR